MAWEVRASNARSILSRTSGFIAQAGFTHSLSPARNCTFGCLYCYVPTMRRQGGLVPEDWQRWGQFTTVKANAPELLRKQLRAEQVIYCSPVVDPYQPTEAEHPAMPSLIAELVARPPRVFVLQTRGPLVLRDLDGWRELALRCTVRVSFSVTTNRESVRRAYEPRCATFEERLTTMAALNEAGIECWATLAPLLPCDPEELVERVCAVSPYDLIIDPLHVRGVKPRGATTRDAAVVASERLGHSQWLEAEFQRELIARIRQAAARYDRRVGAGEEGFSWLTRPNY